MFSEDFRGVVFQPITGQGELEEKGDGGGTVSTGGWSF